MSISIYYNPLDTACKSVVGAIKQNTRLELNVFTLCTQNTQDWQNHLCAPSTKDGFLLLRKDGEKAQKYRMKRTKYGWNISIKISNVGLYFYSFKIGESYISCNRDEMGELTSTLCEFVLVVYSNQYRTPDWFKGGIMYQIFPDRFCKAGSMPDIQGRMRRDDWGGEPTFRPNDEGKILNNDFFGGNFRGITEKLPYLQEFGVTALYLNPIFEAASNHRYDTGNYLKLDPFLGSEEDFSLLIEQAKECGIQLILDGVFNHTGDNSVYFNKYGTYDSVGAYQSKSSPYSEWYTFTQFPNEYESWWGIDILPQINETNASYQEFIFGKSGVLKKWLSFGIGGYRLDVADELPDVFLENLRKSVKDANENAIIIGEVWEDASTKISYSQRRAYLHGLELDSVMNYPWKDAIIDYILHQNARKFVRSIHLILNRYPKQTVDCLMNILGTHDTPRILTVLGGKYCNNKEEMASPKAYLTASERINAIQKLKMAAVLQFTLPGVPCIYYGDENGMEGDIDPFCRRCFDWEHRDEELNAFYKKLGMMRRQLYHIFKTGKFNVLKIDGGLLLYTREYANQCVTIVINNSSKNQTLILPYKSYDYISEQYYKSKTLTLIKPYSCGIFVKSKE